MTDWACEVVFDPSIITLIDLSNITLISLETCLVESMMQKYLEIQGSKARIE